MHFPDRIRSWLNEPRMTRELNTTRRSRLGFLWWRRSDSSTSEIQQKPIKQTRLLEGTVFIGVNGDLNRPAWRECLFDTGCPINLIDERDLHDLELQMTPRKDHRLGVIGSRFCTIGVVHVSFRLEHDPPETVRSVVFHVVPRKLKFSRDCLLGIGWMRANKEAWLPLLAETDDNQGES